MNEEKEYGGLYFQYLFFCKRRLWMHHKGLSTNENNINIIIGKLNHENNSDNELKIGNIAIDKITRKTIYEHKKSSSNLEGGKAQLENYMYLLNNKYNIEITKGVLKYKNGKEIIIEYDEELKKRYRKNYQKIVGVLKGKMPKIEENKKKCLQCGYFEKCYI